MFDRIVNLLLVSCVVVATGLLVHRELGPQLGAPDPPSAADVAQPMTGFDELLNAGTRVGPATAILQIVEFVDFECPFCRQYDKDVREFQAAHSRDVARTVIHFPLRQHRFAIPAARAAECARSQGRFESFGALLFDKQDSLGLKEWKSFAMEAGVQNLGEFGKCVEDPGVPARVNAHLEVARKLGVRATPTIIVNGWRMPRSLSTMELDEVLTSVARGEVPVPRRLRAGQ